MMTMATRSSTTASVSRNERSALGRWLPTTARTARAKAMSVAVGTAQPASRATCAVRHGQEHQRRKDDAGERRGHGSTAVPGRAGHRTSSRSSPAPPRRRTRPAVRRTPTARCEVEVQGVRPERRRPHRSIGCHPTASCPEHRDSSTHSSSTPPTVSARSTSRSGCVGGRASRRGGRRAEDILRVAPLWWTRSHGSLRPGRGLPCCSHAAGRRTRPTRLPGAPTSIVAGGAAPPASERDDGAVD